MRSQVTGTSEHSAARRAEPTRRPSAVSPVQFVEPEHTYAIPEQQNAAADHSDAGMRRLRTPFDHDPA